MAGSKVPGVWSERNLTGPVLDGTGPGTTMPGGGTIGSSSHLALAPEARTDQAQGRQQATQIDKDGQLTDPRVKPRIAKTIQRGAMAAVHGIIVHQTGGATAQSSLDSYKKADANGAHFLVDKDGTIYQTASLYQKTWHVGKLKARCLVEKTCTPAEIKAYKRWDPTGMNTAESAKSVPQRYPSNADSVGIELVGQALPIDPKKKDGATAYEAVTVEQNASLKWLVAELERLLGVPTTEVFRHPEVSWKNDTEASTAQWQ